MATRFQVTVDCADPDAMARFWAVALRYDLRGTASGYADWSSYWRSVGVPEDELGDGGYDSVVDPTGAGPRFWFQKVPEGKVAKNRLHIDLRASQGRVVPKSVRREQVEAEVARLEAVGRDPAAQPRRRRCRPLRRHDARPRGQRVLHQLTRVPRPEPPRNPTVPGRRHHCSGGSQQQLRVDRPKRQGQYVRNVGEHVDRSAPPVPRPAGHRGPARCATG